MTVRAIVGSYPPTGFDAAAFLRELTRDAAAAPQSRIKVYVGALRSCDGSPSCGALSWNHAKIVAFDGEDSSGRFSLWPRAERTIACLRFGPARFRHADGRPAGWTLDFMRRNTGPGTFRGVMEFLIATAALTFRQEGARFVSLSGAPLARLDRGDQPCTLQRLRHKENMKALLPGRIVAVVQMPQEDQVPQAIELCIRAQHGQRLVEVAHLECIVHVTQHLFQP